MLITKQNRLLPILAVMVLLILVLVLNKSCVDEETDSVLLDSVPRASAPDADTPADTIETLTANVAAMTGELRVLRQANVNLRSDNKQLLQDRNGLEDRMNNKIDDAFAARKQPENDSKALRSLSNRIDALSDAMSASFSNNGAADIPVGLGLNSNYATDNWHWVEPLDSSTTEFGNGFLSIPKVDAERSSELFKPVNSAPRPAYTIPRNATLLGATAMTALLGRVPVRGEVRDAMPFKVITGFDNLAANGLTIPGVEGMIWSGTAVGDWTLSCVTGRLESVTFVFDDGSIRTISTDDRENDGGDANRPLGWISDAQGIPCVSGQRKSTAAAFLSQRIGVSAIEAAAEAAAASNTTTVLRDSGAITSNVGGDASEFVLGKTFSRGSQEIAQWLLERQAQSFDAVFVPAGTKLAIHVDRELTIDLDPQGRRLSYDNATPNPHSHRLD
ncbi:MAG: TIGR03752 family integrating conjugative element protein [Proteobacteria bacterium]|nr:TIGR03752 family integrating conjugative element protein [Pseudomonadota bacterium]